MLKLTVAVLAPALALLINLPAPAQ